MTMLATTVPRVLLAFDGQRRRFQPGETLSGHYSLEACNPREVKAVELSILWYTEGQRRRGSGGPFFRPARSERRAGRPGRAAALQHASAEQPVELCRRDREDPLVRAGAGLFDPGQGSVCRGGLPIGRRAGRHKRSSHEPDLAGRSVSESVFDSPRPAGRLGVPVRIWRGCRDAGRSAGVGRLAGSDCRPARQRQVEPAGGAVAGIGSAGPPAAADGSARRRARDCRSTWRGSSAGGRHDRDRRRIRAAWPAGIAGH